MFHVPMPVDVHCSCMLMANGHITFHSVPLPLLFRQKFNLTKPWQDNEARLYKGTEKFKEVL